jgi:cleavage and polyadenylation specificity factor subunit 2
MLTSQIIVQGLTPAADAMVDFCQSTQGFTEDVVAAKLNETINVSMAANIYQLKLTDALVSSLKMVKLGDYELAYVDGVIRLAPEGGDALLDITTAQDASAGTIQKPSVIIGDLRLNEFRKRLRRAGVKADFQKGVLVCSGGHVCVRKNAEGKLIVEGNLGPDFLKIRDMLSETLAVL